MDNLDADEKGAKNAKSGWCFFSEQFILRINYNGSIVIWKRMKLTATTHFKGEKVDMACY